MFFDVFDDLWKHKVLHVQNIRELNPVVQFHVHHCVEIEI